MFWKKKRTREEAPQVLFSHQTDDRRRAYRVTPSPEEPVILDFEGMEVAVADISAVGISLKNSLLEENTTYSAFLGLPGRGMMIECVIHVVDIDERGMAHCAFQKMDDEAVESIHRYVLERQKELLSAERNKKKERGVE
ncbi:MAG: PilZ domain-containing protein [Thermodesulfobacteriota bacterium]|nr:PilZ domain-containing protein [Thermodesulfobacteriota bacterium]